MLPGQRPYRELHWLSRMPGAGITAVGEPRPPEDVEFVARPYRQPTTRFVEAGALAWLRGLDSLPETPGWLASLELCSLVTGQVSALARRRGQRQAVLVWANDPASPLYRLPRRQLPEARLLVLGRGPLEGLVRREAERPGGGVTFLGAGDRGRVASTLRRAAVFVTAPRPTPVWNEQFGLAYIEAMASGLPVVTTVCGSNHEAVREPNLRVPDDAEALAAALLGFLGDPRRRARVGAANRRTVLERHQLDRQCERLGEVLRRFSER